MLVGKLLILNTCFMWIFSQVTKLGKRLKKATEYVLRFQYDFLRQLYLVFFQLLRDCLRWLTTVPPSRCHASELLTVSDG